MKMLVAPVAYSPLSNMANIFKCFTTIPGRLESEPAAKKGGNDDCDGYDCWQATELIPQCNVIAEVSFIPNDVLINNNINLPLQNTYHPVE